MHRRYFFLGDGRQGDLLQCSNDGDRDLAREAVYAETTSSLNSIRASSHGSDLKKSSLLGGIQQQRLILSEYRQCGSQTIGSPIGNSSGQKQVRGCC